MELLYNDAEELFRGKIRAILARWKPAEQFLERSAVDGDLLGNLQREIDGVLTSWSTGVSLATLHSIVAYEVGHGLVPFRAGHAVLNCLPAAARPDGHGGTVNLAVLPETAANAARIDGRALPGAVRIVGRLDSGADTLVLGRGRSWLVAPGGLTVGARVAGLDMVQGFQEAVVSDPLGAVPVAYEQACGLLHAAAIYTAFEQVGGAQRCLEGVIAYTSNRLALGQPIGAFQSVKHQLANVYVEIELARSNAYRALAALEDAGDDGKPVEEMYAILARVSACDAYTAASKAFMHLQGAHGTIWQNEAHLHLRRARVLRDLLGGPDSWLDRMDLESGVWFSQYHEVEAA